MTPPDQQRVFTQDEIDVIRSRHFGWEKAPAGLLASVFGVSVQKITAVLRDSIDPAKLA